MSEKLKNKLYNYEVKPPVQTWEKIASALDESHLANDFPSTLYNMEVRPPSSAWARIRENLLPESVRPLRKRRIALLPRYAAAAAIIGVIAFAGFRLFETKKSALGTTSIGIAQTIRENIVSPAKEIIPGNELSIAADEASNDRALEDSKKTVAKLDFSVGSRLMNIHNDNLRIDPGISGIREEPGETYRELHETGISAAGLEHEDPNLASASRYIMLMTPDGNMIRMSKKLSNLVCCVSGEDQNEDCTDQMCKWREKIASAPVAPAPGNFMDIFGLVKYLQDK